MASWLAAPRPPRVHVGPFYSNDILAFTVKVSKNNRRRVRMDQEPPETGASEPDGSVGRPIAPRKSPVCGCSSPPGQQGALLECCFPPKKVSLNDHVCIDGNTVERGFVFAGAEKR